MYKPVLAWLIMPIPAQSAKCNYGRRVISSFSLRKSQRLRQKEAHCSENGLAQTAHTVPLHSSVQRKRAAIAGTLLWPRHQRSALHRLSLTAAGAAPEGNWLPGQPCQADFKSGTRINASAHPKGTTQDWVAQGRHTDGKQGSLTNTMELPIHTAIGNIAPGAQVKV